jgi:hypothetical protein
MASRNPSHRGSSEFYNAVDCNGTMEDKSFDNSGFRPSGPTLVPTPPPSSCMEKLVLPYVLGKDCTILRYQTQAAPSWAVDIENAPSPRSRLSSKLHLPTKAYDYDAGNVATSHPTFFFIVRTRCRVPDEPKAITLPHRMEEEARSHSEMWFP